MNCSELTTEIVRDSPVSGISTTPSISESTASGRLLYWNTKAEEILGYSQADMNGMKAGHLYHDPTDRRELVKALGERGRHTFEYRLRRKDGQIVWVRGTSTVREVDDGDQRYLGIFEDITEEKNREARRAVVAELREKVRRMQREYDLDDVLPSVREALQVMNVPFNDCGINAVDMSTDPPTVLGHSMTGEGDWIASSEPDALVVEFWRRGSVAYRRDLQTDDPHGEQAHIQRSLGSQVRSVVDVAFSHGTLAVNSLEPNAFSDEHIASIQELAEVLSEGFGRQEDLLRLATERERLLVTLRSIGDGVITTDEEGKITLVNAVAEELTGWTQDDAVGLPLGEVFRIIDEASRQPSENPVTRVVESGVIVGLANHTLLVAKDGTERAIEDSGAPIHDRYGNIVGVVLVFRDVTSQRRMERDLQRGEKLESLGVLAGGIAHDFNNLLTAITGNVSLIKFQSTDETLKEKLTQVEEASFRAAALTQQLLTFSRGGAPVKRLASLEELLTDSATFALRGSNVLCEFDLADDLWPAECDPGQMSQVIHNLVLNAWQSMPDGGAIVLRAENVSLAGDEEGLGLELGDYLKITLIDHGIGIPQPYLNRIFEPYFTTKQEGSGLGLATVYAIIENHDGHIAVESRPSEGTRFTIHLPASGSSSLLDRAEAEEIHRGEGRVLVMDDEEPVRDLAASLLQRVGYEVETAAEGESALRAYRQALDEGRRFACVILDLTVPGGMGGREALERLRQIDSQVKAIVSSGYSNDAIMANPRDYGFVGVVAKPYTVGEMALEVRRVLTSLE